MKSIAFLALLFITVSCSFESHDVVSGNGKVEKRVLSTDTISRVVISDRLDAVLIPSDSVYIILKADENLHEYITVETTDQTLHISCSKHIRMARAKEILIYGRYLKKAEVSARSTFETRDSIFADDFTLRISSGSEAKIIGRFSHLEVIASSGSNAHLEGYADYLNANINSAADLFAYEMEVKSADIVSSSAADARVNVAEEARFNASSAADIIYRGNPKVINSQANSLGDIKKSKY